MAEDRLKKFEEMMAVLDRDVASSEEVAELIAQVIETVRQAKEYLEKQAVDNKLELNSLVNKTLEKALERLDGIFTDLEKDIKNKANKSVKEAIEKTKIDLDLITKNLYVELKKLEDSIPSPTDLSDLYVKIEEVRSKIVPFELKAEDVRDKLESLEGDERLSKDAIKGLEEEIKALRKEISTKSSGGVRRVFQPYVDDFSGSTNGSTKTFYLSRAPLKSNAILVFCTDFPIILRPTTDFTVAGKTLTLAAGIPAPSSGASLLIQYHA